MPNDPRKTSSATMILNTESHIFANKKPCG